MNRINKNGVRAPAGEAHGLLQLLESLLLLHLLLLQPVYQLQLHTTLWNTLQQMSDSNMPSGSSVGPDAAIMNTSAHVLWSPTMFQNNVSASIQQGAEAGIPSSAFKLVIEHVKLRQEVVTLGTNRRQAT